MATEPLVGIADVAELADALDSGSSDRKIVEVQVLSSALKKTPTLGFRESAFLLWRTRYRDAFRGSCKRTKPNLTLFFGNKYQ